MIEDLKIQVEFGQVKLLKLKAIKKLINSKFYSAGAETLFDNIRKRTVLLDGTKTCKITALIQYR